MARKAKPRAVAPEHLRIMTDAGFTPTVGRREIRKLMESDAWRRTWEDNAEEIATTNRTYDLFLHSLPSYLTTDAERTTYFKKYDKPGLKKYRALRKAAHHSLEKMWKQREKLVRELAKSTQVRKKTKKNPSTFAANPREQNPAPDTTAADLTRRLKF